MHEKLAHGWKAKAAFVTDATGRWRIYHARDQAGIPTWELWDTDYPARRVYTGSLDECIRRAEAR